MAYLTPEQQAQAAAAQNAARQHAMARAQGGPPAGAVPARPPMQQTPAVPLGNPAAPRMYGGTAQPMVNPYAVRTQPPAMAPPRPPAPQGNPYASQPYPPPRPPPPQGNPYASAAGGTAGMMMSDEHSKERIQELQDLNDRYQALLDTPSATADVAAKLGKAGSYEYSYKDQNAPGAAPGRHVGPMAQELESIPGVVQDTPRGKMVDAGRLTMANASAIGSQERRLQDLESTYETLNDKPAAPRRATPRTDLNAAPPAPVQDALMFFKTAPTDGQIAAKREELRNQYGSAVAGQFERYAMGLKREKSASDVARSVPDIDNYPDKPAYKF